MISSIIVLSALLFSAATVSPLETRSTCHPTLQHSSLNVFVVSGKPYATLSWTSKATAGEPVFSSTSPSRWYFQQNNDSDRTYNIHNGDNPDVAVTLNGTQVIMDNLDWSGSNVNQKWKIECSSCATDISLQTGLVASECIISSAAPSASGLCIWGAGYWRPLDLIDCPTQTYGNYYFSIPC
ncbi:hypothetical protein DFS33DRAFT_125290 [Desarmillaria ectypa]|nr:hypothetical protein DFS33DRAFT_125290 [Desarmillaria ectypa]